MRRICSHRRFIVLTLVISLAAALGGLPVYVRPQIDPLRRADAIVILGGAYSARYPFGIALASQGWARNVVVSNPKGGAHKYVANLCAHPPQGVTMHCFSPNPPTTRGESQEVRRLANEFAWRTLIVVTFRPHISRARFILQRCFDGDLVMAASP